jgi:hypothetical protein
MSVPLKKDEFDEEHLTTADLGQGKRPVTVEDRSRENQVRDEQVKDARFGLADNRREPVLAESPTIEDAREEVRAASDVKTVEVRTGPGTRDTSNTALLFPNNELEELRTRWSEVQTAFVDEPRRAVEQADGLVALAMKRLAEVFAEERSNLEKQWDRGGNVSTEDLRIALQRYRSFFQRLLSI